MKESPIIFSADSVRGTFAGEKWMTRRVMNPQPDFPEGIITQDGTGNVCQAARRLMLEHGVDPQRDCLFFKEGGSDARVLDLVLQGAIEVGVVRAGTVEWMARQGRCRRGDLRVLHE